MHWRACNGHLNGVGQEQNKGSWGGKAEAKMTGNEMGAKVPVAVFGRLVPFAGDSTGDRHLCSICFLKTNIQVEHRQRSTPMGQQILWPDIRFPACVCVCMCVRYHQGASANSLQHLVTSLFLPDSKLLCLYTQRYISPHSPHQCEEIVLWQSHFLTIENY